MCFKYSCNNIPNKTLTEMIITFRWDYSPKQKKKQKKKHKNLIFLCYFILIYFIMICVAVWGEPIMRQSAVQRRIYI